MDKASKASTMRQMDECGAVAVIRVGSPDSLLRVSQALQAGGLNCVEIAMTTPGALRAIEEVAERLRDVHIGAGTVLDGVTARQAILAGAEFLVSPTVERDVIEMAHRYGKVMICGAMTPTEILNAWEAGAEFVKVFPAEVLGPQYLKAIGGPLPQIRLVPTGGVTAENAGDFVRAGAAMVCAGSWLLDGKAIAQGRYAAITRRARQLIEAVRTARSEVG